MKRLVSIAEPQHLSPPPLSSRHSPCKQIIQSSTHSAQVARRQLITAKGLGESKAFVVTGRRTPGAELSHISALALEELRRIAFPSHFGSQPGHSGRLPVSLGHCSVVQRIRNRLFYSPIGMQCALEYAVHWSAPRERPWVYTPWRDRNERCFGQPTPESRCLPRTSPGVPLRDIGAPHNIQAQQTSRIFCSRGTNPTSPIQPMAWAHAPNSCWRKPLPLTFTLCLPTQFYIVLPEWLLGI